MAVRVPTSEQVRRLADGRDHLLRRLDRMIRAVVLHGHLEVSVHHAAVHIVAAAHVNRSRWVQGRQHAIYAGL